jgi:hypothetical protein
MFLLGGKTATCIPDCCCGLILILVSARVTLTQMFSNQQSNPRRTAQNMCSQFHPVQPCAHSKSKSMTTIRSRGRTLSAEKAISEGKASGLLSIVLTEHGTALVPPCVRLSWISDGRSKRRGGMVEWCGLLFWWSSALMYIHPSVTETFFSFLCFTSLEPTQVGHVHASCCLTFPKPPHPFERSARFVC